MSADVIDVIEVADVIRSAATEFASRYGSSLSPVQRRALTDLTACRTAVLGGHLEACSACGFQRPAYNSCRNRHCPKCQGAQRAAWLAAQSADLLPVPYFHLVFTLPAEVADLALDNPRVVYNALFHSAAGALTKVAADPKHLGGQIGFIAVLHTWGQKLDHHPHVHCLVPGGGLSPDGERWIPSRAEFFLPVRVLSRVFRGQCLDQLTRAVNAGQLHHAGGRRVLRRRLVRARRHEWVVYAKPPFGGPVQVVRYLARYTHRVAIANSRIIGLDDGRVSFRYKDYADGNQVKSLTLPAVEFLRRFLVHVLPPGFIRIRHYGFLANHDRARHLARCRAALHATPGPPATVSTLSGEIELGEAADPHDRERCPGCHIGIMTVLRRYDRPFLAPTIPTAPLLAWNTS